MKRFVIVMLGLITLVSAKPSILSVPLTYATSLTSATQVHGTIHGDSIVTIAERRTSPANEAGRSAGSREREASGAVNDNAPIGIDGRVVDTPEVEAAKAAHAAAHVKEKLNLASEAAKSGSSSDSSESGDDAITETVIAPDVPIRVARVNENINLEAGDRAIARLEDGSAVPLVLSNGVVAALVPVGIDARPLEVTETVVEQNPANDVRSVDALAIAGPALAYGRLIY